MKVGIILGSIREGRVSDRLAKWVEREAKAIDGVETSLIDLKDYPLPLFNEAKAPQADPERQPDEPLKSYLKAVDECQALIVITPEYNRSYSSALKNALDFLAYEVKRKPILLMAHGSVGGAQAISHLRAVFPGLLAITIPPAVMVVGQVAQLFDEAGQPTDEVKNNPYGPQAALSGALSELMWYARALSQANKE